MLKKTITYTDYEGNERKEDFYFNLTKAEILEMELSTTGGLDRLVGKIIAEQDNKKIMEIFKDIILKSYGEKSLDGKRFIKNSEITEAFTQTEAYSELFVELATDANKAAEFINGVVPGDNKVSVNDIIKELPVSDKQKEAIVDVTENKVVSIPNN